MVEWSMDDDDDDDDGFTTEIKPIQREYGSTTTNQPIRSFIAKVYVLGTFRTKKTSDYRQGYSIPSYTMSPMMMMMMMIPIGKARQGNHFCHEQRPAQISCVKRGQERVVGSSVVIGRAMEHSQS